MAFENNVSLVGRLGEDPIKRHTQNGIAVTNIRVAVNENIGVDKEGNRLQVTTWVRVVAWKGLADVVGQYCKKGSMVGVNGRLRENKWTDSEGQERYTMEVLADSIKFLSPKPAAQKAQPAADKNQPPLPSEPPPMTQQYEADLPF